MGGRDGEYMVILLHVHAIAFPEPVYSKVINSN